MFCWRCGKEDDIKDPDHKRHYCKECEEAERAERANNKSEYVKYKFLNALEMATKNLEGNTTRLYAHKKAYEAIKKMGLKTPEAFDSSDEILAAMVLLTSGYHVKTQVGIGNYRVDIFLEKQKTIVEIDGENHNFKVYYDSNRDKKIREMLGAEWEIIRIPTKLLRQNPEMLITAIREVRREKVKVRRENGGIIPAYYSRQAASRIYEIEEILYGRKHKA